MSVKVENLTHIYNEGLPHESVAVQDVSFSIEDGQIAGIIGHTGSGKSTLVQHLNGLIKPKTGSIYIDGENICDGKTVMREIRKKVGWYFSIRNTSCSRKRWPRTWLLARSRWV